MPVVSNTSPILNLAIIDHLNLLRQQFGEIIISPDVLTELKPFPTYPETKFIQQALDDQWLKVITLKSNHLAQALMLELDRGEATAIALAIELKITQVLIDEREGRAKAKALGLEPIGILGVLLRAKFDHQIPSVETIMQALQLEAGFFIADDLFEAVLVEAGER